MLSSAAANQIVDGGFETPQINTFYQNYGAHTQDPYSGPSFDASWVIYVNNVDIVRGPPTTNWNAYEPYQFLDLVGYGSTGGIYQDFSTVAGQIYSLTFAYANNPGFQGASAQVSVYNGWALPTLPSSNPLYSQTITHSGSQPGNIDWTLFTAQFVAASTTTELRFDELLGGNNAGVLLDDVAVDPVPAPVVGAGVPGLFILGGGLIGWWRRKKMAAAAA
jgi:hypothetical protein